MLRTPFFFFFNFLMIINIYPKSALQTPEQYKMQNKN